MTKIVLLRPKILIENAIPNPPLGLGYVAGNLRAHEHRVDLLDCAIMKESYAQIREWIKALNPEVIGITALSSYYSEMRRLAHALHPLHIPIILGGVQTFNWLGSKFCRNTKLISIINVLVYKNHSRKIF